MARAANGNQNIRSLENQAIAKADRYSKKAHTNSSVDRQNKENKRNSNVDVWVYRLVNGKWQIQSEVRREA